MKRLIVRVYRVLFKLSGSRPFSRAGAVAYITALNLSLIYGLSILLKDMLPTAPILNLFRFPYIAITSAAMFGLILALAPSYSFIANSEKRTKANYAPLIIYSAASMLVFMYTMLSDKLF